ncbi:DUF6893 family small protein [Rubrobacter tropicus]|nr:hypothetical protein [Rubrobacter tropicus]
MSLVHVRKWFSLKATALLRLGFYGLVLWAVAAMVVQWPGLKRYMKMRTM